MPAREGTATLGPGARAVIHAFRFFLIALYTVFWEHSAVCWRCFRVLADDPVGRSQLGGLDPEDLPDRGPGRGAGADPAGRVLRLHVESPERGRHRGVIVTLPPIWRFVAKKELLYVPFFGWALATADQVIIDRGKRAKAVASLKRAAQKIRAGAASSSSRKAPAAPTAGCEPSRAAASTSPSRPRSRSCP